MFHWYGKQRAKLFVRSMFHVKPAHAVPLVDVMTRRAPFPHVIGAGVMGGIIMWSIPLALYMMSLLFNLAVVYLARATYRVPTILEDVPEVLVGALPYVAVTGALGAGLAWLRYRSALKHRYVTVLGLRLGLNTIVSSILGFILSIAFYQLILFFGPFLFLLGFIFDGLWSTFYELALERFCRPRIDELLALEAEDHLLKHSFSQRFQLDDVRVQSGKVSLIVTGTDLKLRQDIQEALREIEGVTHIVFERPAIETALSN